MKNRFIDILYQLQNIKRFSNRNVIVYHSPAEHSYYVAQLGIYIAKHENLKREKKDQYDVELIVEKALCHDVPETLIGDILWPVKHHSEEVHKKICDIEQIVVKNDLLKYLPVELQKEYEDIILRPKDGKEGEVVAFCDQLEVLYYLTEERKLGNMSEWIDDVFEKVIPICLEMSKFSTIARRLYDHVVEEFGRISQKEIAPNP